MINHRFAMTSKWMENGNINEFLEKHMDADRFKLVGLQLRWESPHHSLVNFYSSRMLPTD